MEDINYTLINTSDALKEIIPLLENEQTLALDTEANKLDPFTARLLLVQIATSTQSFVIDCTKVDIAPLKHILEAPKPLKILQNAKFDYELLSAQTGIKIGALYDTMLAERLITCGISRDISLKSLSEKYLGLKMDKTVRDTFSDPRDPSHRGKFSKLQLDYAARDVHILLEIFKKQLTLLKEEGLVETAKLEFQVVPVVAEMELKGSLIDREQWEEHIKELKEKRNTINAEIQRDLRHLAPYARIDLFGLEEDAINLDSPLQVLSVFKKLGIELANTGEATLQKVTHPLAKKLLEYRAFEKMITAFGESILEKIHPVTGRLHPDFMQLGADTGRFACNNPNLQQIPQDSKFRSCFIATPGYKMITADYSQIELRIVAEVSQDPAFMEAFNKDIDLHTLTASQMFRLPVDQVSKERRFQAKSINFGLMYGRGATSLSTQLGLSVEESKELLEIYFKTYKRVKSWLDLVGKEALKYGYVRTLGGRKRLFQMPNRDNPDYQKLIGAIERQGKNTPIQGTSADITKFALVFIYREFKQRNIDAHLIHTVHDEIVSEAREDQVEEAAKIVEEQMIAAGRMLLKSVPIKVDVHIGTCWTKD